MKPLPVRAPPDRILVVLTRLPGSKLDRDRTGARCNGSYASRSSGGAIEVDEQVSLLVGVRGHFHDRRSICANRSWSGPGNRTYADGGHGGRERLSGRNAQTKTGGQRQERDARENQ